MRRLLLLSMHRGVLGLLCTLTPTLAAAHPVPFSYLDVHLQPEGADVSLVVHAFDLAHDLAVDDPAQLMNTAFLVARESAIAALFRERLRLGEPPAAIAWSGLQVLPGRQSVRLTGRAMIGSGAWPLRAQVFPYDASHQTFVNVYEGDTLTLQTVLDAARSTIVYYPGSANGTLAVLRRFFSEGARHVATGGEHLLFAIGLVVLGGGRRLLGRVVVAFIAADVLTTAVLLTGAAHPSSRLTDPALALAIVYLGADNLMVRGGRDVRPWMALAFGALHGFWFGGALALIDLPTRALAWSLIGFDVGADLAQCALLAALWMVMSALATRRPEVARRFAVPGSVLVIAGGAALFIERVYFPAGFL